MVVVVVVVVEDASVVALMLTFHFLNSFTIQNCVIGLENKLRRNSAA